MIPLYAGFESIRMPWSGRDILVESRHMPNTDMQLHYDQLPPEVYGVRDTLSWRHSIADRVAIAQRSRRKMLWDFVHFDMPDDPEMHALACSISLPENSWAIAVNEPTIHAEFNGIDGSASTVATAIRMMESTVGINYACCDALCTLDPVRWWATDRLVESGYIKLVGLNFYPHSMEACPELLIREAKKRYPGVRLAVTETGWHVGHPDLPPVDFRRQWIDCIRRICENEGDIEFICWYPWLDGPDWNDPSKPHWVNGWPG